MLSLFRGASGKFWFHFLDHKCSQIAVSTGRGLGATYAAPGLEQHFNISGKGEGGRTGRALDFQAVWTRFKGTAAWPEGLLSKNGTIEVEPKHQGHPLAGRSMLDYAVASLLDTY